MAPRFDILRSFYSWRRNIQRVVAVSLVGIQMFTLHGHDPNFGVGYREGDVDSIPYPENYNDHLSVYSVVLTLLEMMLFLCYSQFKEEVDHKMEVYFVVAYGVVGVSMILLQILGLKLVYSTTLIDRQLSHTGIGLWISHIIILTHFF